MRQRTVRVYYALAAVVSAVYGVFSLRFGPEWLDAYNEVFPGEPLPTITLLCCRFPVWPWVFVVLFATGAVFTHLRWKQGEWQLNTFVFLVLLELSLALALVVGYGIPLLKLGDTCAGGKAEAPASHNVDMPHVAGAGNMSRGDDRVTKPRQDAKGRQDQRGFWLGMTMDQVKSQLKSKYEVKEAGSAYPLGPTPWELDHDPYYLLEVPADGVEFEFNLRKRLVCMREILPPKPKAEGEKDDFYLPGENADEKDKK